MCKCTSGPPGHIGTLQSNHRKNNLNFFVSFKKSLKKILRQLLACFFKEKTSFVFYHFNQSMMTIYATDFLLNFGQKLAAV
jgi:hypothetical protein